MLDKIISEIVGFVKEFGGLCAVVCAAAGTVAFIVFALLALIKRNFEGKNRGKFYAISAMLAAFTGALYGLGGIAAEFFFSCAFLYLFYSLVLFILPVRKGKKDKNSEQKQRELARYIDEQVKKAGELAYAKRTPAAKEVFDYRRAKSGNFCGGAEKTFGTQNYAERYAEAGFKPSERQTYAENFADGGNSPYEYYEESSAPQSAQGMRGTREGNGFRGVAKEDDVPLAELRAREDLPVGEKSCENRYENPCEKSCEKPCEKSYGAAEKSNGFNDEIDYTHVKNVIARLDYFGLKESDRRQIHDLEASLSEAERGVCNEELKGRINDGLSSLLKIMSKYGA